MFLVLRQLLLFFFNLSSILNGECSGKSSCLCTVNGESVDVVAQRLELDLLDDRLVHVVGHLDVCYLGLGDLDLGDRVVHKWVSSKTSIDQRVESGVDNGSGLTLDLLILSFPLLSGFTVLGTGNLGAEAVDASGILDGVLQMGHWHFHLLGHKLGHLRSVGIGEARIRVAKELMGGTSHRYNSQNQQGLHIGPSS